MNHTLLAADIERGAAMHLALSAEPWMQALFFLSETTGPYGAIRRLPAPTMFADALGMAAIGAGLVAQRDQHAWHLSSEDALYPHIKRRYAMTSADIQWMHKLVPRTLAHVVYTLRASA